MTSTWARRLGRWEVLQLAILVILVWVGSRVSDVFLTGSNISNMTSSVMEVSIIALPMTLIIVTGEIDLSVESMLGLSSSILGFLWAAGVPLEVAIPVVLAVGAVGGALNGVLVARAGLPSLVVTLGTLALFRGLASVVLGPTAVSTFPSSFTTFGFGDVPGTFVPWTATVFVVLAAAFWLVAHTTWIGRQIVAIGRNRSAARYSGVRVARIKLALFVVSGVVAALAGVILTARFSSARADNGTGLTLTVVTIVLFGGVDINGGKGTIPGVILAALTVAALEGALRLLGISSAYQNVAIGFLLIGSVITPHLARQAREVVDRLRAGRPPPREALTSGEGVSQR